MTNKFDKAALLLSKKLDGGRLRLDLANGYTLCHPYGITAGGRINKRSDGFTLEYGFCHAWVKGLNFADVIYSIHPALHDFAGTGVGKHYHEVILPWFFDWLLNKSPWIKSGLIKASLVDCVGHKILLIDTENTPINFIHNYLCAFRYAAAFWPLVINMYKLWKADNSLDISLLFYATGFLDLDTYSVPPSLYVRTSITTFDQPERCLDIQYTGREYISNFLQGTPYTPYLILLPTEWSDSGKTPREIFGQYGINNVWGKRGYRCGNPWINIDYEFMKALESDKARSKLLCVYKSLLSRFELGEFING